VFWLRGRSWVTFHIRFVVFCETAGQDGHCADRLANTSELAASIRALPRTFVVLAWRLNDFRT
jgi:hypothetical protein